MPLLRPKPFFTFLIYIFPNQHRAQGLRFLVILFRTICIAGLKDLIRRQRNLPNPIPHSPHTKSKFTYQEIGTKRVLFPSSVNLYFFIQNAQHRLPTHTHTQKKSGFAQKHLASHNRQGKHHHVRREAALGERAFWVISPHPKYGQIEREMNGNGCDSVRCLLIYPP